MYKNDTNPWDVHGLYLRFNVLRFSCSMCQSSSNLLAYIAVAFFSAMSQKEDAAPTYESHNGSNSGGVEHAATQWTRTLVKRSLKEAR